MRSAHARSVRAALAFALCVLVSAHAASAAASAAPPTPEAALVTWLADAGGVLHAEIRRATPERPRGVYARRAHEGAPQHPPRPARPGLLLPLALRVRRR